ncbi:MAG: cation diffusion facilitator family transporter [Bacteroidales bacterium]|jgi:cation diffusion facilitator family transporter
MKTKKSTANFMWVSIIAAILTILFKFLGYKATNSIGMLSDALESFVNLASAVIGLRLIKIAERPPDNKHPFGHAKAEYFASLIEGVLILIAALGIIYSAVNRIINQQQIQDINLGIFYSLIATIINVLTAIFLLNKAKRYNSIALEADGKHLLTDVVTSIGVIFSVLLIKITNWYLIDPIVGIIVSIWIIITGIKLIKKSIDGLMDSALSKDDLEKIKRILDTYNDKGIGYHALYTHKMSAQKYISMHLIFPKDWTIKEGHDITKEIEHKILKDFPLSHVIIHMEPENDNESFDDYL